MPSYTWTPPKLQGEERYEGQEFNPQKAKQLLAEAGYPDGKGFPSVTVYYPTREDVKLVMEAIQDQLKRNLNLKINLENQEWKVFLETLRRDPPPMFRSSWGADYPDPETFMNLFTSHSGTNDTCWKNADYDKLISAASGEADKKKRFGMYRRADQFLCRKAVPIVCTFLSTQNMMIKPWVKGIGYNPLDLQFFKSVEIDESKLKY